MSFFGGGQKEAISKRPFGLDGRRTAQHEQGPCVPVWWGTQRIGTTALTEPFNRETKPSKGAKKGSPKNGDNYAAVVFALGHGPLDVLRQIWVNEELWWEGPLTRAEGEDSVPITIEDFGAGTLYWGTETQDTDPTVEALDVGHPAYRGIAYMVFPSALLGTNSDTVPHFEIVASRWGVYPEFWSSFPAANGFDVGPMSPVIEVITNERLGRGLVDTDLINVTAIGAVATALAAEGLSLSPILDTQVTLRQFFADLAEYIDGWFRMDPDGKLTWGLSRNTGSGGPLLTEADMLSEPALQVAGWNDTSSAAQVVYTNLGRYWLPEMVLGVDAVNAVVTGMTKQPVFDLKWITDPAVASRMAHALAQRNGRPWSKATLLLRPSRVPGIAPGALYRLGYGHLGLNGQQVRVLRVETAGPGRPEITAEVTFDTGLLNAVYAPTPDYVTTPSTSLIPVAAEYQDLWELPAALANNNRYPTIALLCARPTKFTSSYYGHIQVAGGGYDGLNPDSSNVFALRGKVITAVGTSGDIDIELLGVDVTMGQFSEADFSEGRVVAWTGIETVVVTGITLIAARQYTLTAVRAVYGTTPTALAVDAPIWIANAGTLYTCVIRSGGALSVTMKLQPAVKKKGVDLADCDALTIAVDPANISPIPPTALQVFGTSSPVWTGSADIDVTWISSDEHGPVATVLEMWDLAGPTLVATINVPVGDESYVWPYSAAVTALGGTPITFQVRAKHRSGSHVGGAATLIVTR